jgi:hypothetical protein
MSNRGFYVAFSLVSTDLMQRLDIPLKVGCETGVSLEI